MDTIEINANEVHNEENEAKKQKDSSSSVKSTVIAGAAGAALGAGAIYTADNVIDELVIDNHENIEQPEVIAEPEEVIEDLVEVHPDEVMLEEVVDEPILEQEMIAEDNSLSSAGEDYELFSNNVDISSEDVLLDVHPEDVLIAENPEVDVFIEDDVTVDLVCGTTEPGPEEELYEETIMGDDYLVASNDDIYIDDSDIQSDLMA